MVNSGSWPMRLMFRLLPWLIRTGLPQWLRRKEIRLMSAGENKEKTMGTRTLF